MGFPLSTSILIFGCLAGLVATILGAYSWIRTSKYFLPLPIPLSGITTFLPIITAILIPLPANLAARGGVRRLDTALLGLIDNGRLTAILQHLLTVIPTALATFTISYFMPGDLVGCRLENQLQSFYSHKNANASRAIQDRLQCCGLRSTRDRAWPFPGGSEQRDCTSTSGYTQCCLSGWQGAQREAASMIFAAAVLSLVMKFILASHQYGLSSRYSRLPYHEATEGSENASGTHGNSSQRRLITDVRYRDEPGAEEGRRPPSPAPAPSPALNAFAVANCHDDPNNNVGDGFQGGSSGALYISNLRL
ncbi:hypothetical protein AJ78_06967 [Emergomyces pasteurianus Ep9510]|uniref:Tetraspanin Tsp3 n=1 Tax=Emergomyces pasteurianus Ep9510 TaxID=1447872 RepID=A0A1J9Q950_9EURO|nr:hypothetical protein AJ78_06967 [Emergomyces pasteurianus Ep9510]